MKVEPPGLPTRLVDEHEELFDNTTQSRWDVLADTALKMDYEVYTWNNRCRVRWMRYSLLSWCCWRPMRVGWVETQPKSKTFGWTTCMMGFKACGVCGRIKTDVVF